MHLCITVRFLDGRFHGRGDGGVSEWPPSPFRLFQSLLASAKTDWTDAKSAAFRWLECLPPPAIHAPTVPAPATSSGVMTYVPGNTADHGRMPKLVQPRVLPERARHVSYIWTIGDDPPGQAHARAMADVARHIHCLGWGIDLAIGQGELVENTSLPGDGRIGLQPRPENFGGALLRVPCSGSLASLEAAHEVALRRLRYNAATKTTEVHDHPGLAQFNRRAYVPAVGGRPFCAFDLCRPDDPAAEDYASFDPRHIKVLVGTVRRLLGSARVRHGLRDLGGDELVDAVLLGHPKDLAGPRLAILPLLSVGHRHAGGRVRRLLLAEPAGADGQICRRLAELLNGQLLEPTGAEVRSVARLVRLRGDDLYLRCYYVGSALQWATVSPVLLPGFDGRTDCRAGEARRLSSSKQLERAMALVAKSLIHAGIDAKPRIELSPVSWWPGVPHSRAFLPRDKLGPCPRYHVKLTFDEPFFGPLSLGRQRNTGLGVFAATDGVR